MTAYADAVNRHYGRDDLTTAIWEALRAAGKDPATPTPDDLAFTDQFHLGGKAATLDLARIAAVQPGERVLDVGGGIGGPARTLAREFGCTVTVLDLTESYCRTGAALSERMGLADRVTFRHGSALAMPFADGSFDLAWTQHSSMNIEDKERLYQEIFRVVRPGGRLALHEIMAGPAGPPYYPAPWAAEPSLSFLCPPEEMRALLRATGFAERVWEDITARAADVAARPAGGAPPGAPPHMVVLMLGPERGAEVLGNIGRSLRERRVSVVRALFERPMRDE